MKVKIEVRLSDEQVAELLAYGSQRGFEAEWATTGKRARKRQVRYILESKIEEVLFKAREEKEVADSENRAKAEGG